ncbi:cytochrome c oxidase subunit 2A [Salirhabdus sp. Marseille-P4669]|nr:cytochrome c oxidase subunit 2A [Salirhabdus sp. Marseille-P4669]
MAKVLKGQQPSNAHDEKEPELKGTFISVMAIGVFIIVAWIGAFSLFLSR